MLYKSILLIITSSMGYVKGFSFIGEDNYSLSLKNGCRLLNMDQECPNHLFKCINHDCIQVYSSTIHYLIGNRRILSAQLQDSSMHPYVLNGFGPEAIDMNGQYHGAWDSTNNKPADGQGTFIYEYDRNKYIYQGMFKDGLPDGQGKLQTPAAKLYDGEWSRGQFVNGKRYGVFYKSKNRKSVDVEYDGDFENFKPTASASMHPYVLTGFGPDAIDMNGQYQGAWDSANNKPADGQGIFIYEDGRKKYKYKGMFKDGLPDGKGALKTPANRYEGIWSRGKFVNGKRYGVWYNAYEGRMDVDVEYNGDFQNFKPTWGNWFRNWPNLRHELENF